MINLLNLTDAEDIYSLMAGLAEDAHGGSADQCAQRQLDAMEPMLREGCAGQLPEIYEGDFPTESKGCFGQAWSVSEILRVFEAIEKE